MNATLPNFIIIGGMKCGTTSLHYYLSNHPKIFMPREKELNFFIEERNYPKGEAWYSSKFNSDFKINGEASPNYTKEHIFSGVPEKMSRMVPEAKLIFLHRDPVERTWSHYIHNLAIGRESSSPKEALTLESNYIQTSKYYQQLNPYLSFYDPSQLLLINADSLRSNRRETLKRIFDFLGVNFFYDENIFEKNRNKTAIKTERSHFNDKLLSTNLGSYLKKMLPEELKIWYKKITEKPLKVPELTPELKDRIEQFVKDDQKSFKKLNSIRRIASF